MTTRPLAIAAATLLLAGGASADAVAPGDVVFEEGAVAAPLVAAEGDPAAGAEIVGSKKLGNCVACHEVSALPEIPWHGNVGPSLDGAGERWTEAQLRGIVANAKMTFEGTVMPAMYKSEGFVRPGDKFTGKAGAEPLPTVLTAQQIEDVVAYLSTLKE